MVGKKVKLFLKNGSSAEGVISTSNREEMILITENSSNLLIINLPKYNVVMTYVYFEEIKQNNKIPAPIQIQS